MYELFVRDKYFTKVAQIDDFQSLDAVLRFNAPGTWVLELPSNTEAVQLLTNQKAGIVVEKDGKTLFSGPVTGINRKWDKDGDRYTINGYDDLIYLQRNLAYPVTSGPPYTAQDYDVRTGKAETIMKAYLNANIGSSAPSRRKIEITTGIDSGLGNTITGRARFQTLLELLTSLALMGGKLGFRVVQVNNALQFQVYQPSKKKNVVFSPTLGNLAAFEYTTEDPETNYVIVGGSGEGKARTILEEGDSTSISTYGRIETFLDRRDTTDTTELTQALDEELSSKSNQMSLSITPIDTDSLSFGTDYNLGDRATVILTESDNPAFFGNITDVISEVKISLTSTGVEVTPTVGTPDSLKGHMKSFYNKIKTINKRLSNLERR